MFPQKPKKTTYDRYYRGDLAKQRKVVLIVTSYLAMYQINRNRDNLVFWPTKNLGDFTEVYLGELNVNGRCRNNLTPAILL